MELEEEITRLKLKLIEKDTEIARLKDDIILNKKQEVTSHNYLEYIISMVPGCVYWLDRNNIYQGCNNNAAIMLGMKTPEEIIGKTNHELSWKEDASFLEEFNNKVMESGKPYKSEEIVHLGNKKRIFVSEKVPIFDENNTVIGIVGISIDITESKKMEESLKKAKEKSEMANVAKDEFIRNMSHDIRTPLSGIIGMSSILEHEALTAEEKEHAHMINISGEQLLTLLNSVLDIIASGSQKENLVNLSEVNVSELIHNIADLELPTIKLKNLDLRTTLADNLPGLVETDAIKVHRILLNILGNAVKFTEKGFIEIGARLHKSDKNTEIEFFIRDSGKGIKEEDKDKIFKKFYRGTASHQGLYAGHGVGLHIVKRYIQLLKGKISVESIQNEGTTFTISIPVRVIKQTKAASIIPPIQFQSIKHEIKNTSKSKIHVLLIEDNAIALKMAESILTQMGIDYQSASTGAMAIELFKDNHFHFILSDIGLPDMSGFDITRHFRIIEKEFAKTPVPVIGLTAHSDSKTEQEALCAGMDQILNKPIRLENISELITKYNLNPFAEEKGLVTNNQLAKSETDKSDLPTHNLDLFNLEHFVLFDEKQGINNCGGLETLQEMLKMLINTELPSDRETMQKAFEQKNYSEIEKTAHKIKGSAVYIGTIRMKIACQYLERYWKAGERDLFEQLYHQTIKVIDDTTSNINAWLL